MKKFLSLCLTFILMVSITMPAQAWNSSRDEPPVITDPAYMFPAFSNGEVLLNKRQGRLPALGWNSWNAFGSGNTEALTKAMADAIIDLELDKVGYEYVVLDDGCYRSTRVDGKLANDTVKFPSGFKALSDYMHDRGLKFGMYNDIGTNLCAGAAVGTVGYEDIDAQTYKEWGVDYLKVDNCYYLWDNATFSDSTNTQYTYAPRIRSIKITGNGLDQTLSAVNDGTLLGNGASKNTTDNYVNGIGTLDGTNTGVTPVGPRWSQLSFNVNAPSSGTYNLVVNYASGAETNTGRWLQVAVGPIEDETRFFDGILTASSSTTTFIDSNIIPIELNAGDNIVRLMNHRRQENVLQSYAALLDGLNKYDPNHDTVFSICEWGKTQPHNWGYKVGNSWRILNDITFSVGNTSGGYGTGSWNASGTASIASQYNKAVIMDEFSGLDKGWNDPDMMIIGMNNITTVMSKTHMAMWCMMNAPIMLGLDLRRVTKGDELWNIIANKDLVDLNQDPLGIQAKRIYTTAQSTNPDTAYITNNNRVDILAKPLENGDIALSFINLHTDDNTSTHSVDVNRIVEYIGSKMVNASEFQNAENFLITDVWSKEVSLNNSGVFSVNNLSAYDNITIRISPLADDSEVTTLLQDKIDEAEEELANKTAPKYPAPINSLNTQFAADIAIAQAVCDNVESTSNELVDAYVELSDKIKSFLDTYILKEDMLVQINLIKEELASKDPDGLPALLTNANTTLDAELKRIEIIYYNSDSTVSDIEDGYSDLLEGLGIFRKIYDSYDDLKAKLDMAAAVISNAEKYEKDDNWTDFISKEAEARTVYANPTTLEEVITVTNELVTARANIKRILGPSYGPIAWYIFDDPTSTTVYDESGNGKNATLVNSGAKILEGNILSLNADGGSNGYLQLPSGMLSGATEFTLATWVKHSTYNTWSRLFDFGMSSSNGYMFVSPSNGSNQLAWAITATGSGGEQSIGAARPATNEWIHIAVTQTGQTVRIYVNGDVVATRTGTTNNPSNTIKQATNCYVGKSQYNDPYLNAILKDIRIYDKPLDNDQIRQIMTDFAPEIVEIEPVSIETKYGTVPELPSQVTVKFEDGNSGAASVTWEDYNSELLLLGKPFVVNGSITGTNIKAIANISFDISTNLGAVVKIDEEEMKINYTVTNIGNEEGKARIIYAIYEEDGTFIKPWTKEIDLNVDTYTTESVDIIIPDGIENVTIKAFAWDITYRPLVIAEEYKTFFEPTWSVVRPNSANVTKDSDTSITIESEYGDLWGNNDGAGTAKNMYLMDIPVKEKDNFTATVKLKGKPSANYHRAALIVYAGDGNQVSVMRRYHSSYGGNVFMTTMNTNGSAGSESSGQYTADTFGDECLLRVTKNGATFNGYFSTDNGITWNQLYTRTQNNINTATNIKVGFYVSNGTQSATSVPFTFEDFTYNDKIVPFNLD